MEREGEADHARMARFRDLAILPVFGDLSGMGTPSGERSPLEDEDGEKSLSCGDQNVLVIPGRDSLLLRTQASSTTAAQPRGLPQPSF
jgi:hypothetical protein